jgi:signal transduction histidine kinase/CheY-like chemotaxis protein/HPt (histidine-containing phosphotransfer) domain-containing protein
LNQPATDANRLNRRLERERKARQEAERLLEDKSHELFAKHMELEALSQSLEKLVAKRTIEMQQARDEALYALQVKTDFIANMSHELRTPLNGVLGVLALLSDQDLNEQQSELVDVAEASGKHLLGVINDILDFSKIEADKISLEFSALEIRPYIKTLCAPFKLQATQKNIAFEFHVDEEVPDYLMVDSLRLTQIISNLLSNALKFTDEGGVSLSFVKHGGAYRISVTDTGIGISSANLESIFAAFEQADNSITREFGGTGLGMSITKQLVTMFGGKVNVTSEMGKGSCFFVDLPLQTAKQIELCELDNDSSANDKIQALHVLLVEDNAINQMVATKLLEGWGCEVSLAENGQVALDNLAKHGFDLVLMDLQMPVMGGIQATEFIRSAASSELSENIDVPIIAMTAHSSQAHIDECIQAGMNDHISKPIDRDLLKQKITKLVGNELPPADNALASSGLQNQQTDLQIPEIKGVDVISGLARVNNDVSLYLSLLQRFCDDNLDFLSRYQLFIEQNNKDGANMALHMIKGSAANVGIEKVSKLAAELEAQLHTEQAWPAISQAERLQQLIEDVKQQLALVDNSKDNKQNAPLRVVSNKQILDYLHDIKTQINQDFLNAEASLKELLTCELSAQLQDKLENVQQAMARFDTVAAANDIEEALELLG